MTQLTHDVEKHTALYVEAFNAGDATATAATYTETAIVIDEPQGSSHLKVKADNLEGVGGPRFLVQDSYSSDVLFASEDLTNVDFWKQINGKFTTGPDTKLVVVRVQRNPPGSPIKGTLWIDGLRLVRDDGKA